MENFRNWSPPGWVLTSYITLLVTYPLLQFIYYNYFHPLAKIPGSPLWCSSRLPFLWSFARGNLIKDLQRMHEKYGQVLRIAPDEVTFAHPDAWNDIMLPQPGRPPFLKHPVWWNPLPGMPRSLISSLGGEEHTYFRKFFAPPFTSRALKSQEPILHEYVDLLVDRLCEVTTSTKEEDRSNGQEVDIWLWYNFFTFDVFSELAFGESFGCLERGTYHSWIVLIFDYAKAMAALVAVRFFPVPGMDLLLTKLLPPSLVKAQQAHFQLIVDKVRRRLERGQSGRPDIMSYLGIEDANGVTSQDGETGLPLDIINATFSEFVIAGSESTGVVLTGAINYLAHNTGKLEVLVKEIRDHFTTYDEISLDALRDLTYLNAVLNEALRLCPSVRLVTPRQVPKGGATVCGRWLPAGVSTTCPKSFRLNRADIFMLINPRPARPDPIADCRLYHSIGHASGAEFLLRAECFPPRALVG